MKYFLSIAIICSCFSLAVGQNLTIKSATQDKSWVEYEPQKISGSIEDMAQQVLELSPSSDLKLRLEQEDELGMTHIRLDQFHDEIEVYGAQYVMHLNKNKLVSSNGNVARLFEGNTIPSLSEQEVIELALTIVPSQKLAYTNSAFEEFAPSANLLWYPTQQDEEGNGVYSLVYKVEIYSLVPHFKNDYFIDAHTGEELNRIDALHTTGVPHQCETFYYGERTIIVDSLNENTYRLHDEDRLVTTTSVDVNFGNEVDLINDTSYWSMEDFQFAELDAHWGALNMHDYLEDHFDRNSVDDRGLSLECKVVREPGYSNAFWNGRFTTYGAGNGTTSFPFTILDVVGHEFTHGTVQFTCGLIYQGESGALNESFADIFGKGLELYTVPDSFTWVIGKGIYGDRGIRSMKNPEDYENPKLYGGEFWADTSSDFDNGGVHINSGVQNYWFYLLVDGETGTNERGQPYDVQAIGMEKAEQIAYRNMAFYLNPSSTFREAAAGSIQSAIDLYGICSDEHIAVAEAWYAVGVNRLGVRLNNYSVADVRGVETDCNLGVESISAVVMKESCADADNPQEITMYFQVDNGEIKSATYNVEGLELIGDELEVPLLETVDVTGVGEHVVKVWTDNFDKDIRDDTLFYEFNNLLQQNADFLSVDAAPIVGSCDLETAPITGQFQFNGCDSIDAGASLELSYLFNGVEASRVTETYVTESTLYPGDLFSYTFNTPGDFSEEGPYEVSLDVNFEGDPFDSNNMDELRDVYHTRSITEEQEFKFTRRDQIDEEYSYLVIGEESEWTTTGGGRALQLSGGSAFDLQAGEFTIDYPTSEEEMWNTNQEYNSEYCMCVDATEWDGVELMYKWAVTRNPRYTFFLPEDLAQYGSAMRLKINDVQYGETAFGAPLFGLGLPDVYVTDTLDLSEYKGQYFNLCFQSHHFLQDGPVYGDSPDATYLDNIVIREKEIVATEEEKQLSKEVSIFPNPAQDELQIILPQNIEVTSYSLVTVSGQRVVNQTQQILSGMLISVSDIMAGAYILEMNTKSDGIIRKPFVKL